MLFACQGWKWHSPACYWVGEDLLSFDEAKKSCEGDGAALVTITNRYVQTHVHTPVLISLTKAVTKNNRQQTFSRYKN